MPSLENWGGGLGEISRECTYNHIHCVTKLYVAFIQDIKFLCSKNGLQTVAWSLCGLQANPFFTDSSSKNYVARDFTENEVALAEWEGLHVL